MRLFFSFVWVILILAIAPVLGGSSFVYHLDIGTPASPVAEGYTRVLKGDVYSAQRGYGWSCPAAADFDRSAFLYDLFRPPMDSFNPLTRDGVQEPNDIELQMDVPNGEYWVRITCGDPCRSCEKISWDINGKNVLNELSTKLSWCGFVTDRTTRNKVTVTDGAIRIRFHNSAKTKRRNSINAISVHPAMPPSLTVRDGELMLSHPADDCPALRLAFKLWQEKKYDEAVTAAEKVTGPRSELLKAHLFTWIAGDIDYQRDVELVNRAQKLASVYHATHPDDWDSGELAIMCYDFVRAVRQADRLTRYLAQEYGGPNYLMARRLQYADDGFERIKAGEALYEKALWHNLRVHSGDQTPFSQNPGVHTFDWFLRTLLTKYPENETLQIYNGAEIPWGKKYLAQNAPANAPQWAMLARELLARCNAVISWWVKNRQASDGQLGGGWGDDCEILRRWPVVVFCGDSPVVREGMFRLIDGLWDSGILTNGFQTRMADIEHSAEPSADTQPWGILLDYGNPKYVERNMLTMQLFGRLWTGVTSAGHRHFKSSYVGALEIKESSPHTVDVPYAGRAVRNGQLLIWYNQHSAFLKLYHEWMSAWAEDTAKAGKGKPAGIIPAAVCFEDDNPDGHGPNWTDPGLSWSYYKWPSTQDYTYDHLLTAYLASGDDKLLGPLHSQMRLYLDAMTNPQPNAPSGSLVWAAQKLNHYAPFAAHLYRHAAGITDYDEFLRNHGNAYMRFILTGEEAQLIESMEESVKKMRVNFPKMTNLVVNTDRMPLFPGPIFSMYTGGYAMNQYPTYYVTWTGVKTNDFAAFVTSGGKDHLTVRLYNFNANPMAVRANFWRLQPGQYEVSLRPDSNGDGRPDGSGKRQLLKVAERGQPWDFPLPSQKPFVLEIKQQSVDAVDNGPKADLAIGLEDIKVKRNGAITQVHITVHNIGIARSAPTQVQVLGNKGQVIGSANLGAIDWPADMEPKTQTVVVTVPAKNSGKQVEIALDPQKVVKESVRLNNRLKMNSK